MDSKDLDAISLTKVVKDVDKYLWAITNNVVCTICHELYTEPVTTPCGHSFCSGCLKRLLYESANKNKGCPLCRHPLKRRETNSNLLLSKISKICGDFPEAFREDVLSINTDHRELLKEFISTSRILDGSTDKDKDKDKIKYAETPTGSKSSKRNKRKTSAKTCLNETIISSTGGNQSCKRENSNYSSSEIEELQSVSRIVPKPESNGAGSPEVVKKLKNLQVTPKRKVTDWLRGRGNNKNNTDSLIVSASESICKSNATITPETKFEVSRVQSFGSHSTLKKSMIRVDYDKTTKQGESDVLTANVDGEDPYEFIASQRSSIPKVKKRDKRKKSIPAFQSIQCFTKDSIKKNVEKKDELLANHCEVMSQMTSWKQDELKVVDAHRTYSKTSKKVVDSDVPEVECQRIASDQSKMVGRQRKARKLSSGSDEDEFAKKPRMDDEDLKSRSPGWSRLSTLKKDFETAEKHRHFRKSLNISGGELTLNNSKGKTLLRLSPQDILNYENEEVFIDDVTQSGDVLVGFDTPSSSEEKDFKHVVRQMEKELLKVEKNESRSDDVELDDSSQFLVEKTTTGNQRQEKEIVGATLNTKKVPFSLLGKIKKRNLSVSFLRLGRLSPCRGSPLTKNSSRDFQSVGIQASVKTADAWQVTKFNDKVEVEVQTTQCKQLSKEVQTSQIEKCDKMVDAIPSQLLDDFGTAGKKVEETRSVSSRSQTSMKDDQITVEFDSEIQRELNNTWTQREGGQVKEKDMEIIETDEESEVIDLVESPSKTPEEQMKQVLKNIELDLQRVKAVSAETESDSDIFIEQTPPKTRDTFKEPDARGEEESFLLLSECQDSISKACQKFSNDENDQNRINTKLKPTRRICIVSSGVRNRKNIDKFVAKFDVELFANPTKDMTHLIVGLHENDDDELVPFCTPKFLYAMANKKWIVSESWVEACLNLNSIVAEGPFESVDPMGGRGCTTARLSNEYLLEKCEVLLLGDYQTISKEEFSGLIRDCGGRVVRHPSEFSKSMDKIRMILADSSDSHGDKNIELLARKHQTVVMSRDVIIMSIQSWKICNFTPYLLHSATTEELVGFGYPLHLVKYDGERESEEESESCDEIPG